LSDKERPTVLTAQPFRAYTVATHIMRRQARPVAAAF